MKIEQAKIIWVVAGVGALTLFAVGCDNTVDEGIGYPICDVDPGCTVSGTDDTGADTPGEEPVASDRRYVMIPASGHNSMDVVYEGSVDLGVYLYSLDTGEAVPDQAIQYTMTEEPFGGSNLTAANAVTDSEGSATLRFVGGMVPGVYHIIASHPEANQVRYKVTVLDVTFGSLEVTVLHPTAGASPVRPISIRLYKSEVLRCSFLARDEYPSNYMAETMLETISEPVIFGNILAEESFSILATGFGEMGGIAARACLEDVVVQAGVTLEVELVLN